MSCNDNNTPPCFARRLWNFTQALVRHVGDGGRLVTEEEQAARLAACESCPLLKDGICTHPKCGCGISGDRAKFWNKLSWASERCPANKWPKLKGSDDV